MAGFKKRFDLGSIKRRIMELFPGRFFLPEKVLKNKNTDEQIETPQN